jgi:hypothetical protein
VANLDPPLSLSRSGAVFLAVWYSILAGSGFWLVLRTLTSADLLTSNVHLDSALAGALGAALISSSLFYVRRLYKGLFAQSNQLAAEAQSWIRLATMIYFLSRPLFALLFAVLVVVTGIAFIHAVTEHDTNLSAGFVLFSILISAYGAAVTGSVVQRLESVGAEKIRNFGGL